MTCHEFYSLLREEFIKDNNILLIENIQQIRSRPFYGTYGTGTVAFCEMIIPDNDRRNIIRFIGNIVGGELPMNVQIELISVILLSPSHPNLGGFFEARRYLIFDGSIEDSHNPGKWNIGFLMNILNNYYSFMK
jgi:hypothetical protein